MSQQNIRNFAIIAHIDHGKSTLSDRMLEITKTITKEKMVEQFLDRNPISRERGITIKLAPVRMKYKIESGKLKDEKYFPTLNSQLSTSSSEYILNLIDTPGHVDFSYEVSRTLACCEGAVLLVDATQGIQAQTVAHLMVARKLNLTIIPVLNKIDLPNAQTELVTKELCKQFGFVKEEILYVSAKTGENVKALLDKVITKIPAPKISEKPYLRALVFDALYDEHRGVIAFVRLFDGTVKQGDKVKLFQTSAITTVTELGFFAPFLTPSQQLNAGDIGYIITGIKDIRQCHVGDTIITQNSNLKTQNYGEVEPLPGYQQPKPMVFFGMYPKSTDEFAKLKEGLSRLVLTDSSVTYSEEYSAFLGSGFRVGFLGLLHAEIVKERLAQEAGVEPLLTMPQVLYEKDGEDSFLEPYMKLNVYTPIDYVGPVMTVCQKRKGNLLDLVYYDAYAVLTYEIPYSMFIRGLSSDIKSVSQGFASVDYEMIGYKPANLVSVDIQVNSVSIDVLSELVYKDEAIAIARKKTEQLKETLPRQQIRQIIQGVVDNTIVAREEISPFRKDVLKKMSGGDRTRKDKLLDKQKKGKAKMLSTAKIDLPQEALFSFFSTNRKAE